MREIPSHFILSVLPKIGGSTVEESHIFPKIKQNQKGICIVGENTLSQPYLISRFPWISFVDTFHPDSSEKLNFPPTDLKCQNGIVVAQPSDDEARQVENLQQTIWGSNTAYPHYLYHPNGPAATRLVAKQDKEIIGFLLGFWGQYNGSFWLESQITGTNPSYRKGGVAKMLKFTQQGQASEASVDSIRWTVDPLQKPNAFLNYNSLGAIATTILPDHYRFQNDLNRVPASRFQIRWPSSREISDQLKNLYSGVSKNDVLTEIPENWTEMQTNDHKNALSLRQSTDMTFNNLFNNGFIFGKIIEKEGHFYLVGKERPEVKKVWPNFDT
jgi:predicted GNAT superfamily acetyltransferase